MQGKIFELSFNLDTGSIKNDKIKVFNTDQNAFMMSLTINKNNQKINVQNNECTLQIIQPVTGSVIEIEGENKNSYFSFNLTSECNELSGEYQAEIKFISGNQVFTSDIFFYNVQEGLFSTYDVSISNNSKYPVLQKLINDYKTLAGLNGTGDLDMLGMYQTKEDDNLNTTKKDVVGAINDLIEKVKDNRNYITAANKKVENCIIGVNNRVIKEEGKGLSTNDYTTEDKNKLNSLKSYTLPNATRNNLGGVKVGETLNISSDGVINIPYKIWTGTKEEYNRISPKDNTTLYFVKKEQN